MRMMNEQGTRNIPNTICVSNSQYYWMIPHFIQEQYSSTISQTQKILNHVTTQHAFLQIKLN